MNIYLLNAKCVVVHTYGTAYVSCSSAPAIVPEPVQPWAVEVALLCLYEYEQGYVHICLAYI